MCGAPSFRRHGRAVVAAATCSPHARRGSPAQDAEQADQHSRNPPNAGKLVELRYRRVERQPSSADNPNPLAAIMPRKASLFLPDGRGSAAPARWCRCRFDREYATSAIWKETQRPTTIHSSNQPNPRARPCRARWARCAAQGCSILRSGGLFWICLSAPSNSDLAAPLSWASKAVWLRQPSMMTKRLGRLISGRTVNSRLAPSRRLWSRYFLMSSRPCGTAPAPTSR
jgi:hypothetical protein